MITLTTDFGLKDPYVAEMKGVILSINPYAQIVDVTHGVDKFGVRMGAFMLASAVPYFPNGTVHVAVVDPGVGTDRRAIIIQTELCFFVGPDNGVLLLAAIDQGIKHLYEITNPKLMLSQVSFTFHGRDVFAPAAAYLDKGIDPQEFGSEITEVITPKFATVDHKNGVLIGEVLHVDGFGNVVTNIPQKEVDSVNNLKVRFSSEVLNLVFGETYAQVLPRRPIALIGSHGFLEIAVNQGNAAEEYKLKPGDRIEIVPV